MVLLKLWSSGWVAIQGMSCLKYMSNLTEDCNPALDEIYVVVIKDGLFYKVFSSLPVEAFC